MSQGFRKGNKRPEVSETTGITPPTRIDENRNTRRAQQINHLHQQFEDLKQKIKEVENKNEKIIEKIHKAYNFKKKSAYNEEYLGRETSPVIHYENRFEQPVYSASLSADAQSNMSGRSGGPPKMQKKTTDFSRTGKEYLKNERFNQSMEYGRADPYEETESVKYSQAYMGYGTSGKVLPPAAPAIGSTSIGRQTRLSQQKVEKKVFDELNQQKQNLEQDLLERDNEIYQLQSQLKGMVKNAKRAFEGQLEEFMENPMHKGMAEIERTLKKYEQKLKNIKKMAFLVKDKHEDRKSSKILEAGRQRRSRSRSRISSPRKENREGERESLHSNSRECRDGKDQAKSRSRVIEQQEKNKKQFQEIADKYEEFIRGKIEEIEKWDKKYRLKERECYELKMRVEILQKKLNEDDRGSRADSSFAANSADEAKPIKKFSTDSNLLAGLEEDTRQKEEIREKQEAMEKEMRKLKAYIAELETAKSKKTAEVEGLTQRISSLDNKSKNLHLEYQQNLAKAKQKLKEEHENTVKEFEMLLSEKNMEIQKLKAGNSQIEKKLLEKDCENFSFESKLKKIEALLEGKDKKIEELEKMMEANLEQRGRMASSRISESQLMERSLYASQAGEADLRRFREEIERLEEELENLRSENYEHSKSESFYKAKCAEQEKLNNELTKEVQALRIDNEQLKIDANINNISVVDVEEEYSDNDNSLVGFEGEEGKEKGKEMREKYEERIEKLEKQRQEWYEKYIQMKNFGLENESKCIKMATELQFMMENRTDVDEEAIETLRSENEELKRGNGELVRKLAQAEQKLEQEKQKNQQQLDEIEKKLMEYDEQKMLIEAGNDQDHDVRSSKSSNMSFNLRGKVDHIHVENEYLTVKLREAEAEIETMQLMEKKIIDEYKNNMEEAKKTARIKDSEIEALKEEIEDLHRRIADISLRVDPIGKGDKDSQRNQLMGRIEELELQLKQNKQYTKKMSDMEEQLFEEIKIKQEETAELYEELKKKEDRIRELEEMAEMKETIPERILGSHISSNSRQRESQKSQSSLEYSSNTRVRGMRDSQRMHTSNASNLQNKLFDLDLSEAGESFFEQPSQLSNISEIFEREEIPYEKMKIKRQEQVKLFEKTATYIKSLKRTIEEKNKRIKILQKKIESLKSSELVRKEIGMDVKEETINFDEGEFKDYESVQLEYRRGQGGYFRKYKQLENDTKLVMEENNMLIHQIEALEEELMKAEEQENSLVKIKDLYKEEIKKLIKKNEEQTKSFEEELRNERKRVEDSESIHNFEALKKLFIKLLEVFGARLADGDKKREDKRKEMESYVNIICNILQVDKKTKESMFAILR